MNFFEHQDRARSRSKLLFILFTVAVLCTVAAIVLAVGTFFPEVFLKHQVGVGFWQVVLQRKWQLINVRNVLMLVWGVLAFIFAATLYKSLILAKGGGQYIAESLGGRLVYPGTKDEAERRLLNVIEEMALASGTPVPQVYLLEHEDDINAFAAGFTPEQSVIGVTKGTLERLNRDSLQGVMAHEFSHIANGDMRLNVQLIGMLFGLLCLREIGYYMLRSMRGSRRGKGNQQFALLGLAFMALGAIGYFFGLIIKSALSRQREFLADASAVQYTRNPQGISDALKTIGGVGSKVEGPGATAVSHMFFAKAFSEMLSGVFSTHPPLAERIKRIEGRAIALPEQNIGIGKAQGMEGLAYGFKETTEKTLKIGGKVDHLAQIDKAGRPTRESIQESSIFLEGLPQELLGAVREPFGARAAVFGLLYHHDQDLRTKQMESLRGVIDQGTITLGEKLFFLVKDLRSSFRLPIIDLASAALKQMALSQMEDFIKAVKILVMADGKIDVFEFVLLKLLYLKLLKKDLVFANRSMVSSFKPDDATVYLLSLLSDQGSDDPNQNSLAYANGIKELGLSFDKFPRRKVADIRILDPALARLGELNFRAKEKLLKACTAVVMQDSVVSPQEAEMLTVVARQLGCPVPSFLGSGC